jgi:hypothetical protein
MRGTREVHVVTGKDGKVTAQGRKVMANNVKLAIRQGRIRPDEAEVWLRSFARDYERTVAALAALPPRNEDQLYRAYAAYDRQLAARL